MIGMDFWWIPICGFLIFLCNDSKIKSPCSVGRVSIIEKFSGLTWTWHFWQWAKTSDLFLDWNFLPVRMETSVCSWIRAASCCSVLPIQNALQRSQVYVYIRLDLHSCGCLCILCISPQTKQGKLNLYPHFQSLRDLSRFFIIPWRTSIPKENPPIKWLPTSFYWNSYWKNVGQTS